MAFDIHESHLVRYIWNLTPLYRKNIKKTNKNDMIVVLRSSSSSASFMFPLLMGY
jgi:hypothetical protein